jgi:hypothetical protein
MYICQIPRIREICLLIDLPRFHSFLLPLGKFEKIGIFGKKEISQNSFCIVNMFKTNANIFLEIFRFFDPTGTSLRTQKGAWLNAKEVRRDHVPQNRSNRSFGFQIGRNRSLTEIGPLMESPWNGEAAEVELTVRLTEFMISRVCWIYQLN